MSLWISLIPVLGLFRIEVWFYIIFGLRNCRRIIDKREFTINYMKLKRYLNIINTIQKWILKPWKNNRFYKYIFENLNKSFFNLFSSIFLMKQTYWIYTYILSNRLNFQIFIYFFWQFFVILFKTFFFHYWNFKNIESFQIIFSMSLFIFLFEYEFLVAIFTY